MALGVGDMDEDDGCVDGVDEGNFSEGFMLRTACLDGGAYGGRHVGVFYFLVGRPTSKIVVILILLFSKYLSTH